MSVTKPGAQLDAPHKAGIERVIESAADGLGRSIGWSAEHGILFAVFAVLWLAFGVAAVLNPAVLGDTWAYIGGLPLIVQLVLWLLFLPVMAGLWVWQNGWPALVQIGLELGLAAFTLLVMRPTRRGGEDHATAI